MRTRSCFWLCALAACCVVLLGRFPAAAQLVGTDTAPGDSCAGFAQGATRMTADPDHDGGSVVLICDGTTWQPMSGSGSGDIIKYVTADQSKTSNTTLSNITDLSATLTVGKNYLVRLIIYDSEGTSGGIKMDLGGGTAAFSTFRGDCYRDWYDGGGMGTYPCDSGGQFTSPTTLFMNNTTNLAQTIMVNAFVMVSTGGTIIPRFAQKSSNATPTTILKGSMMIVRDLAGSGGGSGDNLGNHTATQDLAMSGFKVTGLGTPTASTDAATKAYVDSAAGGTVSSCPTGWTMIGDAGKLATFCIDTDERTSSQWKPANATCAGVNDTAFGRAHLCTYSEWYTACLYGSGLSNMTNNAEWIDALDSFPSSATAGNGSCTSISDGTSLTNSRPFRCCMP